ncbi:hypothetical protein [Mycolicibacterium helvum]|uniref:Transmembrane protein n=1 Tax=Mycolicibacterium helvum TaxID=1534349 RepID=A0A7I7T4Y0_9MYCO|nr:hypothetical protein [Mycolicibacterium helvum]BBY64327.1 hypothetical protein MHEL_25700 [Mycolicibacterium helvum]
MRAAATAAHLVLWVLSGALYFLFVLPRWWELMGDTSHTLGTVLRIVTGVVIALAALPVLATLLRTRKPELGTPQVALRLRVWSMSLYVLAGVLIVGAAVAEIWVSLDKDGKWLFGIYGAAAAIAVLALLAYNLAHTAELPAKAPKPKKEKAKRNKTAESVESGEDSAGEPNEPEAVSIEKAVAIEETVEVSTEAGPEDSAGGLRNKRPTGKTNHRLRRRNRGAVAVDESE